jgi:cytochrome c
MKFKLFITLMFLGLLSACGTQPTDAPASTSTEAPAAQTPAFTDTPSVLDTVTPTDTAPPPTEIPANQGTVTVSFTNDVLPILNSRCRNCHGGDRTEEGLILLSYDEVMLGSNNGLVINPGAADNSLLVELVATQEMPKRGLKLTPPQVQIIIDWVNQGALNN